MKITTSLVKKVEKYRRKGVVVRAKTTHLVVDEELEGFGGEAEEEVCGGGGSLWKDAIKACRVAREICGSRVREAAVFKISSSAVRSATFFLVVREVADVPTVLTELRVPTEALEAMVSPKLLMVETSSWAFIKTSMSSWCSSRGTSGAIIPRLMSWVLSSSRSSSFLS